MSILRNKLFLAYALFGPVCFIGGFATAEPNSAEPVDNSGKTSIVVIYGHPDSGNWAEIRGPARYTVLSEWEAYAG
jgi:hypothetical protein